MTASTPGDVTDLATPTDGRRPRRFLAIGLVLIGGVAVRLLILFFLGPRDGFADDLRLFADWARILAEHGPGGFYENALPAGTSPGFLYTPGYLYVLWVVGVLGRAIASLTGAPFVDVIYGLIKLPAILADLAIAVVLYRAASRWWGERAGVIAAAVFLYVPLTWYDSAIWGQVDAVGSLVLLGSLLALVGGWAEVAVGLAVLALVTKPQYGVGVLVVAAVLFGRHLLRPGSGPVPKLGARMSAIDRLVGGLFTERQGGIRLASSAIVGVAVFVLSVIPFDLSSIAPGRFTGIPFAGNVSGLVALVRSSIGYYPNLTVNAFNPWALFGSTPLTQGLSQGDTLTLDSVRVFGAIPASLIGTTLFAVVAVLVLVVVAVLDRRTVILVGFTVLALAFFMLPTRAHERYLYPAFVTGALLAGASLGWRWWAILLGVVQAANIHALITLPIYGSPAIQGLWFGSELRKPLVVAGLVVAHSLLFAWAIWQLVKLSVAHGVTKLPEAEIPVLPPP